MPGGANIQKTAKTFFKHIQITPLLWRPQDPQDCLEKQNCPLSSNLDVWCSKTGSKTKKLWKSVTKLSFSCHFWSFSKFLDFGRIKPTNLNSVDNFVSLDTLRGPGGIKVVEWNQNQLLWSLCIKRPELSRLCHLLSFCKTAQFDFNIF